MKNIILLTILFSSLSSCLKEYTCSCTKTDNVFPEINATEEFTISSTKNNAEGNCLDNNKT